MKKHSLLSWMAIGLHALLLGFLAFEHYHFNTHWVLLLATTVASATVTVALFLRNKNERKQKSTIAEKQASIISTASEKIRKRLRSKIESNDIAVLLTQLEQEMEEKENELEKKNRHEELINWTNTNTAHIAETLRLHNNSVQDMGRHILIALIDLLNLNQGGLFVIEENEEKQILVLQCAIAWERERFAQKTHEVGYGLIGRAAFEKKPIYLTDVPENYIEITSGLGKALPRCVFILPLIYNNEVTGVIELASFHPLQKHEQIFLEKTTTALAASITSVKTNEKTQLLLSESQNQTEMLQSQEEEMRQNLEEVQATQEEMERKEAMLKKLSEEVKTQEQKLQQKIEEIRKTNHLRNQNIPPEKVKLVDQRMTEAMNRWRN
ncbi:MAG: GAF domain-containing protein [Salinivirgaceae bacterium]|jgi:GAF domain-containing protein|nr:GAF domain-containing protein [Salinivirgaceae bacterium]